MASGLGAKVLSSVEMVKFLFRLFRFFRRKDSLINHFTYFLFLSQKVIRVISRNNPSLDFVQKMHRASYLDAASYDRKGRRGWCSSKIFAFQTQGPGFKPRRCRVLNICATFFFAKAEYQLGAKLRRIRITSRGSQ